MAKITEQTLIPLGVAVMAIGGGAAWLTQVYLMTQANGEMITKVQAQQDVYTKNLEEIRVELGEIKTELRLMRGKNGK